MVRFEVWYFFFWKKFVDCWWFFWCVLGFVLGDIVLLQYMSGIMGVLKGVIFIYVNFCVNVMQGWVWVLGFVDGEEMFYGVFLFFYVYGMMLCFIFVMSIGVCFVFFLMFDLDLVMVVVCFVLFMFFLVVLLIYDVLVWVVGCGIIDFLIVWFVILGVMSLLVVIVECWEEVIGGIFVEGYGMIESFLVVFGNLMGCIC